jgi:hypothetical protein
MKGMTMTEDLETLTEKAATMIGDSIFLNEGYDRKTKYTIAANTCVLLLAAIRAATDTDQIIKDIVKASLDLYNVNNTEGHEEDGNV